MPPSILVLVLFMHLLALSMGISYSTLTTACTLQLQFFSIEAHGLAELTSATSVALYTMIFSQWFGVRLQVVLFWQVLSRVFVAAATLLICDPASGLDAGQHLTLSILSLSLFLLCPFVVDALLNLFVEVSITRHGFIPSSSPM